MGHLQSFQAGGGQDDGVIFTGIQLGEAGVDVAPQVADHEIRARSAQLALTAQAGGADHGPLRQLVYLVEMVGNKGIARVFALTDGVQAESVGELHRYVFHGVDSDVGTPFQHGSLQFLDEQPLAADLGGGVSRILSPWVLMGTSSTCRSGWSASSRSFTKLACHRASGLFRVAILRVRAAISISCFIF